MISLKLLEEKNIVYVRRTDVKMILNFSFLKKLTTKESTFVMEFQTLSFIS